MPGPTEIGRAGGGIDGRERRGCPIRSGDTGRHVRLAINRYTERGAERRRIRRNGQRDFELIQPCARHGQTDLSAPVLGHEVDRLWRHFRRRHRQIAFVLAIFIVDDDEHAAGVDGGDRLLDRRERAALSRAFRDSDSRRFIRHDRTLSNSSATRTTYLPSMSHSRFTGSPTFNADTLVCAQVNGMIMTSNWRSRKAATVRLMPSTATDTLAMK